MTPTQKGWASFCGIPPILCVCIREYIRYNAGKNIMEGISMPQMVVGILFIMIILMSGWFIGFYNKMLNQRLEAENHWTQFCIQLRKRADLILSMVEFARNYEDFNQEVLEVVMQARYLFIEANTKAEMIGADQKISSALSQLFNVSQQCPNIISDANFIRLKQQIKDVKEKVSKYYVAYNNKVCIYNDYIKRFPNNIASVILGIKKLSYF